MRDLRHRMLAELADFLGVFQERGLIRTDRSAAVLAAAIQLVKP